MLGDFFNIQNQDQLNRKQLNDLIIEARRKKREEINEPAERKESRQNRLRLNERIRREHDKIDNINLERLKIERENRLAEAAADRERFTEDFTQEVENAVDGFRERTNREQKFEDEITRRFFQSRKNAIKEAREFGDSNQARKQRLVEGARNRTQPNRDLAADFQDRIHEERRNLQEYLDNLNQELKERGQFLIKDHLKRKDFDKGLVKSPAEFNELNQARKRNIVANARERAEATFQAGGDPEEKGDAFRARKAQALENANRRLGLVQRQFDAYFEEVNEILKGLVALAYEKGDEFREAKKEIVANAAENAIERIGIQPQRFKNLFQINRTDVRFIRFLPPYMRRFLLDFKAEQNIRHENLKAAFEERLEEKQLEKILFEEKYIFNEKERTKKLIYEPSETELLFEEWLERLASDNIKAKNDLYGILTLLDKEEYQKAEEIVTQKDTTYQIPKKDLMTPPKEIMTFIDDVEKLEDEKADALEKELLAQKEELEAKEKIQKEKEEELINEVNQAIKKKNDETLQEYFHRIVEIQNKTAHERAVELGQFINLFF